MIAGEMYRVSAPQHAAPVEQVQVDDELLDVFDAVLAAGGTIAGSATEAAMLYLLSNTDSSSYQPHTELLLLMTSIQQALGVADKHREHEIRRSFEQTLENLQPATNVACSRSDPSRAQFTPRALWLSDMYRRRNAIAHGDISGSAGGAQQLWTDEEHLFLGSFILPLALAARCASELSLSRPLLRVKRGIRIFDKLLGIDIFEKDPPRHGTPKWKVALSRFDLDEATQRLLSQP